MKLLDSVKNMVIRKGPSMSYEGKPESFFLSIQTVNDYERELEKGSIINVVLGPVSYERIKETGFRTDYERLMERGLMIAFNPNMEDKGYPMRDGRYVISCRIAEDLEKRRTMVINDLYRKSLPLSNFSQSAKELEITFMIGIKPRNSVSF
jgi:hypothetical protein